MKLETLNDRLAKANEKVAKKQNTIVKKTAMIEKKRGQLEKLGHPNMTRDQYYEQYETLGEKWNDIYWTICDIDSLEDDIKRIGREIEETKKTIAKYEAQIVGEVEKEAIFLKEIPESMKEMQNQLVEVWDTFDMDRRAKMREEYNALGYAKFFKKYSYNDYELQYMTDEQIHNNNMRDAKELIIDLYYRVRNITGEVTDWSNIRTEQGTWGFAVLNGFVIGKEGKAKVESILAGGYNIQRLHVRVLVHEIG